jgi:hypothetical protein
MCNLFWLLMLLPGDAHSCIMSVYRDFIFVSLPFRALAIWYSGLLLARWKWDALLLLLLGVGNLAAILRPNAAAHPFLPVAGIRQYVRFTEKTDKSINLYSVYSGQNIKEQEHKIRQ